MQLLSYS